MTSKHPDLNRQHFSGLNYTLANEDTSLEYKLLPYNTKQVVVVAGSGGRVLPLLAKKPERVTVVDLSQEQLFLVKLRIAALQTLSYEEYLGFFGLQAIPNAARRALFLRLSLEPGPRAYFEELLQKQKWNPFLYQGKWERRSAKQSKFLRLFLGGSLDRLFRCESEQAYQQELSTRFPMKRLCRALAFAGRLLDLYTGLYPHKMPNMNVDESYAAEHQRIFSKLLSRGEVRRNFFLQLMFLGELRYAEGWPIEFDATVFAQAKEHASQVQLRFVQADIESSLCALQSPADFVSMSNVASYFSETQERNFLQNVKPHLSQGGLIVSRQYRRNPTRNEDRTGYELANMQFTDAIEQEKTQVYTPYIYRRTG